MKERKLGLLGKKIGMTRVFDDQGRAVGVTVVELGPNVVLRKRTQGAEAGRKADGYNALALGFDPKPVRRLTKAETGYLTKVGGTQLARRFIKELRVSEQTLGRFEVGQEVSLKDLEWAVGSKVDVTGTSKGRGFQGVMHRYHFAGFRATHGTHEYFRHGGSIGCRKWPGRVFKGRRMPGHMGDRRVTTQNVVIVALRPDDNVILLKGSVPGANNGYVMVRPAIKKNPLP